MTMGVARAMVAVGVLLACAPPPAVARDVCHVADSFSAFADLAAATSGLPEAEQARRFRETYLARRGDLYAPAVMRLPSGDALDRRVVKTLARVREHPEFRAFEPALARSLNGVANVFGAEFPDFRCDFPVYATETFDIMDGAGRVVAGRPAMVLGVDTIARSWSADALPVFLSHELFHRYHFKAAGFSDDLAERDLIWRSLWAEGLATYVSARLNPSRPLADALIYPKNLEARARPFAPQMAAELLAKGDTVDPGAFAKFFEGGDPAAERAGWPSRAGYYIGYRVAEDIGRRHSLMELAHMKGPALHDEIRAALGRLAAP